MGIFKRGDSPYWWVWIEGTGEQFSSKIPIAGATTQQTRENRKLAEAVYNVSMGDTARDRFKLPSARAPRTVDALADWYLEHHTAHHRGAVQERTKIARLRRTFGRLALDQITPARWQEYVTERTQTDGVSLSTTGRELAILKTMLNVAIGDDLEFNPLATVKRKATKLPAKRTITAAEERQLLAVLSNIATRNAGIDDRTPEQTAIERAAREELKDLYVVGVGTLLRQDNLVHLQVKHVQRDRLALMTKTGPHTVPLNGPTPLQKRAAAVLRRRVKSAENGYLFPVWRARFGRQTGGRNKVFVQSFSRACKQAGIPWGLAEGGVVWHTATRASGATRMLRDYRVDIRTVQLIGGWRSLDQMAEYLGVDAGVFGERRESA